MYCKTIIYLSVGESGGRGKEEVIIWMGGERMILTSEHLFVMSRLVKDFQNVKKKNIIIDIN